MTLRTRLLAALVALLVVLAAAGAIVTVLQRGYLYDQLDQRIETLTGRPGPVVKRLLRGGVNDTGPVLALTEVHVGVIRNGKLVTLLAPTDDPDLVPAISAGDRFDRPTTASTAAGQATHVRLVTAGMGDGVVAVFAIATDSADDASSRLVFTLSVVAVVVLAIVALIAWWVIRLGLRPIRRMTEAADAISAGATDRRIEVEPGPTEAARLGHALNTMIDTSQAAEARMRRFVADASHELRTPLTTLRGYSALKEGDTVDAMRRINQEATRMARIVDDLLDLTDMDEHGVADRTPFDLAPVLRDLVSDLRVVQPERPITLSCPHELPIVADRDRIVQAAAALATNALRHTSADSPVEISGAPTDTGGVRIEVTDHGTGIAQQHLPHLFDRFYRVDRSRARASGGNGLGLAIVAGIVDAHGGRYGVRSQPGGPTTFWFELP